MVQISQGEYLCLLRVCAITLVRCTMAQASATVGVLHTDLGGRRCRLARTS
ncbi:MAG: hypothetical protein FWD66_06580 [Paludibacter sp.]|nr:hypothetical protein [Paludibacter sp.]